VVDSNFKLVRYFDSGKEQVNRYNSDAAEDHNLIHSGPEVADQLRQGLSQKISEVHLRVHGSR